MEATDLDLLEVWAVFYISRGKYYTTKLSDISRLSICESQIIKYSDAQVMKFTKAKALKIAKYNKGMGKYGIVNHLGQQELM